MTDPGTGPQSVAEGFAAAWNERDARALAALFVEDADFVNVVGLWWSNRQLIQDRHAYGFTHMFPHSTMTLDKIKVRPLGEQFAIVHARWTLSGQISPQGHPAGDRFGVISFTVTRAPHGQWLALSAQNTDRVPGMQTHVATAEGLSPQTYAPTKSGKNKQS